MNPLPSDSPIVVRAYLKGPDRAGVVIQPTRDHQRFRGVVGRFARPPEWPGTPIESGLILSAIGAEQVEQLADALIEAGHKLREVFHLSAVKP